MRKTIKALLRSSVICLFCVSMLTSSSYAWYTEFVDGGAEESAVLLTSEAVPQTNSTEPLMKLYWNSTYNDDFDTWSKAIPYTNKKTGAIFEYTNWEPGYVQARYVRLENSSDQPLKYYLKVEDKTDSDVTVDLAQVIDVYFMEDITGAVDRDDLKNRYYVGTLAQVILASSDSDGVGHGALSIGESMTGAIVLKMKENAGNEYQEAYKDFDLQISLTPFNISNTTL